MLIQIFLVVSLTPSNSYLIEKVFSESSIGIVSAEGLENYYCCPKTNSGAICQTTYSWYGECSENLLSGSCAENNCLSCCPETNSGQICKDVAFTDTKSCSMNLVSGSCTENNCQYCCTKTKDGEFCQDTSKYHNICASGEDFVVGSCVKNNCRVISSSSSQYGTSSLTSSDLNLNCCVKTNDGAICQDISSSDTESCVENSIPSSCNSVGECKVGCCIDEEEGLCSTKSTKAKCESDGGKWNDEDNCLINECQRGCCVLGEEVLFVTSSRCEKLSAVYGTQNDFKDFETELECLILGANQKKGACVFSGGACKFGTEKECLEKGGTFSKGSLCSNPKLGTNCEKQASVSCVEGKDEIYWIDSCGNQENIYSSDKNASWNNGKVLTKENSCGSDSANINSKDCGNCDYFLGSLCSEAETGKKIADGNIVCKSMNCIDKEGVERKNGESWCVYDSYIGDGKDAVGSRHWKQMCINGEIKIEACADYRGQICVQSEMKDNDETFTSASCVMNEAPICLGYNAGKINECSENKNCMVKSVDVDSGFGFDVCIGRYPWGSDLQGEEGSSELCSLASQTCKMIYVKDWKGNWKCQKNCACATEEFSEQMNDLCTSLGDCGSYVNYIGDGTNNVKINGAPEISWKDYKNFAKVVDGQIAEPNDLRQVLGSISGMKTFEDINGTDINGFGKGVKMLGTISGGVGSLVTGLTLITKSSLFYAKGYGFFVGQASAQAGAGVTNLASAVGSAATGVGIGITIGYFLAQWQGITGTAAGVMMIAGGVAGGLAIGAYTHATWFGNLGAIGVGGLIVSALIVAYIAIIGWGQTEIREVSFTCMPWQAPLGGENCGKCDDDPLKPCSEYRCESLGQACQLVNANTENPVCEAMINDGVAPKISFDGIEDGYTFTEETKKATIKGDNKDCITEFTPVLFSLKTDEYAQCKFEFQQTEDYNSMTQYPIEQNRFSKNHSFFIFMPSLGILEANNLAGDLKEMYGDVNLYVRCQDYYGNQNVMEYAVNFCVNSGPDLTATRIVTTEPTNGKSVKYNESEMNLKIYLNEPAECNYASEANVNYYEMKNTMECKTGLQDIESFGWVCNTTLTELENKENKFYIKCRDKPWVVTTEDLERYKERNINEEDYVYIMQGSKNNLKIDSISPSGIVKEGFEPISINLEVETSGGIDNGVASCSYSFSENSNKVLFFETNSNEHLQNFNQIMHGDYEIYVECEDEAGNIANGKTEFNIDIDTLAPQVIRVYKENGNLKIITDEEAECSYDFNSCNFDIRNAEDMTSVFSTMHSAKLIAGNTYHIKCTDVWGNTNTGCAIEVLANDLN